MTYYDFHSHIIPGIDDGAHEPEISAEMLRRLKAQGVEHVVLSPHFYVSGESADEFCKRREEGLKRLRGVYDAGEMPAFTVGAEVAMRPGLSRGNLENVTLGGSRYIMLEMPFDYGDWIIDEIERILLKGFSPIFAHIERPYVSYRKRDFEKLIDYRSFIYQLNVEAFENKSVRKHFLKELDKGARFILGSDCHNLTSRVPDFDSKALTARGMVPDFMNSVTYNSKYILDKVGEN